MKASTTLVAPATLNRSEIPSITRMSSVEISELTGKRHDNVMRVANRLFEKGIISSPQTEEMVRIGSGAKRAKAIYRLNKTESLNLVANLSPEFTAKIIDRWQELEATVSIPQTLPEALRLAADAMEKNLALENQVQSMKPTVQAFDRIAAAENSLTVTEAAKNLQIQPKKLTQWLSQNRWLYKQIGSKHWLGYQDKIQAGLIEHKIIPMLRSDGSERVITQARITPKGLTKLSIKLNLEVIA